MSTKHTHNEIARDRAQNIRQALPAMRRIYERKRAQLMSETDGRRLRRIRREYAQAIDTYLDWARAMRQWERLA